MDEKVLETMREVVNQHSKTIKQLNELVQSLKKEVKELRTKLESSPEQMRVNAFNDMFTDALAKHYKKGGK